MAMANSAVREARSLGPVIEDSVGRAVGLFAPASLFSRLLFEHMGIVYRSQDEGLCGKGNYTVFYSPIAEWSSVESGQKLGDWIYGEWSDRSIDMETDFGVTISGSRIVLAKGKAIKDGNATRVELSHLGVGLVQSIDDVDQTIHFIGAIAMEPHNKPGRQMEIRQFYSAITGFINSRGDRATPMIYPLKSGGRQ